MSTVLINATDGATGAKYRAKSDDRESSGSTPGAALDALAAMLGPAAFERLVVYIEPIGTGTIASAQQVRLKELTHLYRLADAGRASMSDAELGEMEELLDAQFVASERRAEAAAGEPGA